MFPKKKLSNVLLSLLCVTSSTNDGFLNKYYFLVSIYFNHLCCILLIFSSQISTFIYFPKDGVVPCHLKLISFAKFRNWCDQYDVSYSNRHKYIVHYLYLILLFLLFTNLPLLIKYISLVLFNKLLYHIRIKREFYM